MSLFDGSDHAQARRNRNCPHAARLAGHRCDLRYHAIFDVIFYRASKRWKVLVFWATPRVQLDTLINRSNCTPYQASAADKDPIVLVAVSVQWQEWRVAHIAASGTRYGRTQQYGLRDESRPGARAWTGTLIDRPYLKMVGLISNTTQG